MKNNDIFLDAIGDTDEKLLPELTAKKKRSVFKWTALGGVCAAVIACIAILPKTSDDTVTTPSDKVSNNAMLLAAAAYPEMPVYPDETKYSDLNDFELAYDEWSEARMKLRNQPEGYQDGFATFFLNSTQTFLDSSEKENVVFSPLSLYMALSMSVEITDGNSRQQILGVLAQSDIETLRSHSKSIWQANYIDDGMAKCILANSLWTNSNVDYNQNTVDALAETYYSSVYSGDPLSDDYNKMLQDWLNAQTDGLLTDYVSDINMNPEMILTLASTVNYSGKWNDKFLPENTAQAVFHAINGDVECDFMNADIDISYCWGEHFSSVSLPLENNGHMKLILPNEGYSPNDLLNDEQTRKLMLSTWDYKDNKYVTVNMSVPKFDVSSSIELREGLNALGITDIFDAEKSDFTPLTDSTDKIFLSKAEQDTRVMIDEEGCKAASMTVMMYDGAGAPEDHVEFTLDRPFIFEIMSDTGLPLFVGIVNNPSA